MERIFIKKMKLWEIIERIRFGEVSARSWEGVNKSKLPDSCFFWPEKRKLPYREGAGPINPDTGRYSKVGPINRKGLQSAWAAIQGARTGDPMSIPSEVRSRVQAAYRRVFGHEPGEEE